MEISIKFYPEECEKMFGVKQIDSKNLIDVERVLSSKTGFDCTMKSFDAGSGCRFIPECIVTFSCQQKCRL